MKLNFLSAALAPIESALQPYIDKASETFARLSKRDQAAAVILVVFLSAFMLYSLLWAPLNASVEKAKKQYHAEQSLLAWMKAQESNVLAARKSGNKALASANVSLLTLVNDEARRSALALKRYEPDGDNKLRVWLEDVPFDVVIIWMNTLVIDKGLNISSATVDAEQGRGGQSKSGYVNVKVVFEK